MERSVTDKNLLNSFCTDFCSVVEKHAKYIVVSGFLAVATGRARGTEDIDIILERLDKTQFTELHNDLVQHGFTCIQSNDTKTIYDDYLTKNVSVRYTHDNNPLPEMEIKLAKDALDYEQIQTRIKIPLTGLNIWFSSIEANIAFKEEYLKSDKDLEDARHLRIIFNNEINEGEIVRTKKLIRRLRL